MADYQSGLPIRTEDDGADEKVHVKLTGHGSTNAVGDTAQNQAVVDSEGQLHVQIMGDRADDQTEVALRLSETGHPNPDGDYDADANSDPASVGLIAHDRVATPNDTNLNFRLTGKQGTVDKTGAANTTVHALDIALHDEDGNPYTPNNPLAVVIASPEAGVITKVHDYNTTAALAKDATVNHDYSIADTKEFRLTRVWASASGKLKVEVQVGDGAISETFTTVAVGFNSTANPNVDLEFTPPQSATGTTNTTTIRIILTNRDQQAMDVYSTLMGNQDA